MEETSEKARPIVWPVTVNLAGLDEEQLREISPITGGVSRRVMSEMPENLLAARTVILPWGDERLTPLLADVATAAGYPYGGELLHVVAVAGNAAIWFVVAPKAPYDIDHARDDNGEIDSRLLALLDPALDPNAIFYKWDAQGAEEILLYMKHAEPGSQPWVDVGDYQMAFELATTF
jgi:hypothetical protein